MLLRGVAMVTMATDFEDTKNPWHVVTIATPLSKIK